MDIDKIGRERDFTFPSSIGELKVGRITMRDEKEVEERFPRTGDADPTEYARFLFSRIGGRPSESSDDPIPLAADEIAKLTTGDLDTFATLFLEKNANWLLRDPEASDPKGNALVDLPRQGGEDVKAYLRRVRSNHAKRHSEYLRKAMERMVPRSLTSNVSTALFAQNRSLLKSLENDLSANAHIQETLRLLGPTIGQMGVSDELQKALAAIRFQDPLRGMDLDRLGLGPKSFDAFRDIKPLNIPEYLREPGIPPSTDSVQSPMVYRPEPAAVRVPKPAAPLPEPLPNPLHKTNETLVLVATRLESVANLSATTATLVGNMNELGLGMAKSSAEHAERTAKQNWTMIGIGVIAIVVSTAVSIVVSLQDRVRDAAATTLLEKATEHLDASQGAFLAAQRDAAAQRAALQKELETQRSALQAELNAMAKERQRQQAKAQSAPK